MNISKRSYKELAIPYFKEVFVLIDQAMNENEIPYYLIGVNAISLELLKSGVKPSRGTKDIDFAVMIILKLVSWSDRPEERENDLADILMIIDHYFDHFFDEIIKFHVDLFTEDFNKYLISAEVLGREARLILNKSDILEKRIINLLESQIYAGQQSKIARNWAIKKSWDITFSQKVISAFRNGLNPYSGTPVS
jgi:predicted nucleotidyltransferase